jgi:hypothetical protein
MIGVDIGVPVPARKIKQDPAAQTRSLTILVVAVAAIIGVILLALIISRLGGGDANGGNPNATATLAANSTKTAATATSSSGLAVTPGKVPDLVGTTVDKARLAITEAGFVVKELHQKDAAAKNTIVNQAPSPNADLAAGQTVTIVVSDGP